MQEGLGVNKDCKLKQHNLSRYICLLATFILVAALLPVNLGDAIVSTNISLNSNGVIVYPPSTSTPYTETELLRGVNSLNDLYATNANVALIRDSGGNAIRMLVYISQITDPTIYQRLKDIVGWAKANELTVILTFNGYWDMTPGEHGSPVVMTCQHKAEAIYNVGGFGDYWISTYTAAIRDLQPDWVEVMNEPPDKYYTTYQGSKTYQQFYEDYRSFIIKSIDAFAAVKPDLKFMVESAPCPDNSYLFVSPRVDELRPAATIMYEAHLYYAYESSPHKNFELSYWSGNLATAKIQLYDYLLTGPLHVQTALNLGLDIYIGEAGVNMDSPNWNVYMDDMFEFCETYNLGLMWHQWRYEVIDPSMGMLNNDWKTLNGVGQHWASLVN